MGRTGLNRPWLNYAGLRRSRLHDHGGPGLHRSCDPHRSAPLDGRALPNLLNRRGGERPAWILSQNGLLARKRHRGWWWRGAGNHRASHYGRRRTRGAACRRCVESKHALALRRHTRGHHDAATLRAYLVRGQQMAEPPELHVQPDPQARYEMVDKVLAVAKRAQVTRMGFVGNERYANF